MFSIKSTAKDRKIADSGTPQQMEQKEFKHSGMTQKLVWKLPHWPGQLVDQVTTYGHRNQEAQICRV